MSEARIAMLDQALRAAFAPQCLEIRDDSALHVGHASAGEAGHFAVYIVSEAFAGLSAVKRHQAVYAAVADLMGTEVHALSIEAKTPQQVSSASI